jgi:hypothetical protein
VKRKDVPSFLSLAGLLGTDLQSWRTGTVILGSAGGAREEIVGQDLQRLASFFDYISPMEYSALTHRGQGWVERLNRDLLAEVPAAKLLPSIEVGPDGPQFPPMSLEDYESDLKAARKAPAGVVLYHLELLLDDPAKQDITKRIIGGR